MQVSCDHVSERLNILRYESADVSYSIDILRFNP